jgi:hypothetical protein
MNSTSTLTFLWTPWSVALSISVVLLGAILCLLAAEGKCDAGRGESEALVG